MADRVHGAVPVPGDDPAAAHDARASGVTANGAEVWERIRARVEQRLAVVELQAHRLLDRALTPDETEAAARAANALASGLGALQQHGLAQLARHIETTITADALDATTGVHIAGAIEDLRTMLASAIAQLENANAGAGTVLAIGDPTASLDALLWVLATRGHLVRHHGATLPPDPAAIDPVAVVAAIGGELDHATRSVLHAVAETWRTTVIVLHEDADLSAQRAVAPLCDVLLPVSVSADSVIEEIARHRAAREAHLRALICGADAAASILEAHGFEATLVARPDDLLDVAASDGTAVIFGGDVPSTLVFDLTRLVRVTPAARRAPIVWLGDHDEVSTLQAQHLGIIVGGDLDDGAAIRVASQMRQAAADVDPAASELGNLLSWPAARVLVDRSLVAAQRASTATSVATIDLAEDLDPEHLSQLTELIGREFRRTDIVGQRDRHRFVVSLGGAARRTATNRMTALAPRLASDDHGVRIGVAEFPADGRSADELVAAADAAVARSLDADGPAVAPTTWRPVGERVVDVLIVDPDPVLGVLIATALARTGYRSDHIADGRDALERLTSAATDALPRVVMIEVDLTGVDGLTLLRSLRPSGVLAHCQVLVVTARAAEDDIRTALDLGAADVIRKPFSTTLLLHRVSRMIEA